MAIFAFSEQKKSRIERIYDLILHEGLLTYSPKSAKASLLDQRLAKEVDKHNRKGAIFAVRNKSDFTESGVKGYIITSKETAIEHADKITHFTPNVYRRYQYADQGRRYIKGFVEENLQQINTFVVDIDTKQHTVQEILLTCVDESIGRPTLILSSDRGYQVYFVLETPIFISNKNEFRSLKVAKRISDNLKRSLQLVDADLYCNDFGFFRMPNNQNVEWLDETAVYTPASFIQWSQQRDDDLGRALYAVPTPKQVTALTQSDWFHQLIHATDVKGEKGKMGRNNVLFTLALVCLQDGKDQSFTFDLLDQYNSNLHYPLSAQEIKTIAASAYSGKYKGAKKEYIEQLLALYVQGTKDIAVHFGHKNWYKHKKARKDRQRSHCHEWEQDITNWIAAEKSVSEPFIWRTQKELCEEIGIASSTLNKILKQSKVILKTTIGKGRNAKTGWTTVALYIDYIIWLKQDLGTRFSHFVRYIVKEQLELLEQSAGYTTLTTRVGKMLSNHPITEQLSIHDILINTG